jgi:hypothetical protein
MPIPEARRIRPARSSAGTRPVVAIEDLGTFGLLTHAELTSFTCDCGHPDCSGDLVGFMGCGHQALPGYDRRQSLLFLICSQCRVGIAIRVAPDA